MGWLAIANWVFYSSHGHQPTSTVNMQSRFLRLFCLALLSLLLIVSCHRVTILSSRPEPQPLKVGCYSLWPGFFPMILAQEKGFFAQQGVQVEPIYSSNYLEPVSNFSAGYSDGVTSALGSLMSLVGQDTEAQMVLVSDQSAGADMLVVAPGIQGVKDLKGKRIGVKLGDFGELFVTTLLKSQNLTTADVTLVNTEAELVPDRIAKGDIQAGHAWEPHTSEVIKAGGRVLLTSQSTPGLIADGIVFHQNVVRDRPEQVQAFVRGWFQAVDYWQAHPQESNVLLAKALKLKPEEISTEGVHLATVADNLKALAPGQTTESLYYTAKLYADFFIRAGGLSAAPDINQLIVPSFVQALGEGRSL